MLELRARSKRSGLTSWLAREELRGSLCLPSLTAPLPHSLPRSRPGPGLFARPRWRCPGGPGRQGLRGAPGVARPRRARPQVRSGVTRAQAAKAAARGVLSAAVVESVEVVEVFGGEYQLLPGFS